MFTLQTLPKPDMAEIERIKTMSDNEINTSEIPELSPSQLKEAAAIARKKRRFANTDKTVIAL